MAKIYTTQDYEKSSLICMHRVYIKKAMLKHEGHRAKAAKDLGITERTLYRKLTLHNI
jgi:DNA-binding NtrC family response regulator